MLRFLPLLLLTLAGVASAAERRLSINSFERVRVEGAFQVAIVTGRSPSAMVSGDAGALEQVEVRVDGTTLVVRNRTEKWTAQRRSQTPLTVTLATPVLVGAHVLGGGALTVTGAKTQRLDLSVAGAGSIAVTGAEVEQANATVIGNGQIALAGRAARARLMLNGAGKLDADKLVAGDVTVRVDGAGEATARARYTANVTNTGLGRIAVAGTPKCMVRSDAGGPVTCGLTPR
ncbi:GIN domain-containing protein [Sphingomonas sp.]|jgi:hypothetical protein|uniref:GIN domain-containing protein n=1 Tax=Sphingomonas sp. TaxID=28214 RepID=UPI002D806DCA|nr:DUF2807 domain-containing protein [Sphingomonas sp.]HEU0045349.1 DUF2807 domain-containing protein [Sphingomonas sp.]